MSAFSFVPRFCAASRQRVSGIGGLICLAVILTVSAHPAQAADTAITKQEWAALTRQNDALRASDTALNATYRKIMRALSADERRSLLLEQRRWLTTRDQTAGAYPKDSSEYAAKLAELTGEREKTLRDKYLSVKPAPAAVARKTEQPAPVKAEQPKKQGGKLTSLPRYPVEVDKTITDEVAALRKTRPLTVEPAAAPEGEEEAKPSGPPIPRLGNYPI